jgi:Sec-independent protein translocase protein TatA
MLRSCCCCCCLLLLGGSNQVAGFVPPSRLPSTRWQQRQLEQQQQPRSRPLSPVTARPLGPSQRGLLGPLYLFGPMEGFLGLGGPEVLVIATVGYFLLGPQEMFRLSKSLGEFLGTVRDLTGTTVTSVQNLIENQIAEAEERAQAPNLDAEWGNVNVGATARAQSVAEVMRPEELEDVEIVGGPIGDNLDDDDDEYEYIWDDDLEEQERKARARAEYDTPFWESAKDAVGDAVAAAKRTAAEYQAQAGPDGKVALPPPVMDPFTGMISAPPSIATAAAGPPPSSRFAQQLSGDWNRQVLESEAIPAKEIVAEAEKRSGMLSTSYLDQLDSESEEGTESAGDVPDLSSLDAQFERLEQIAQMEDERASLMQKIDEEFEKRMQAMKSDLMQIVEEDYRERRESLESRDQ